MQIRGQGNRHRWEQGQSHKEGRLDIEKEMMFITRLSAIT